MTDWQVGDLALCVRAGETIRAGEVHTVETIWPNKALSLVGKVSSGWRGSYHHWRFIKVTPPAADEFDRETIALMNRVEQPA